MPRILVVDDEKAFRMFVQHMLVALGHECVEAGDGAEAEKHCANSVVDLVLLDIIMPGQDGIVTIRNLLHHHPKVKIVAMSGGGLVGASEYLKAARQLGVNAIMEKPFSRDELGVMIDSVLAR
jgi:CheY-like chemotaxis protein